ncbi:EAL domain-containing protein [Hydrogenophaga sp. OTU3427]|uniref:EAL domain-containing protein n=1 Tax=Hydrogenophaga sp. OTU3427 TaxID=3043856 RepID=UPI00313CE425
MNIDATSLVRDMGMNAGLLSFLAALYGIAHSSTRHPDRSVTQRRQALLPWVAGLMFGVTGILTMLAPLRLSEGVIVDARLVVAGLAGAYLTPLGALLCAMVLAGYRLGLGGIGSGPAMVGIVLSTGIGWLWQRYRPLFAAHHNKALGDGLWLAGLGLSLAAGGMLAIQTLPSGIARMVTERTWLAVSLIYPVGAILLGYLLDNVHQLRQREESLERTAEQLKTLLAEARQAASVFFNSKDTIAILQPDGTVLDVNPTYCAVLGYTREELIGKSSAVLRVDEGGETTFLRRVAQALERDGRWHGELVRRRKNGEAFVSEVTIEGVLDPDGTVRSWVSVGKDVTEQRRLELALQQFGNYDALTGLPSRRLFTKELNATLRDSGEANTMLALCVLDIDQFKGLNDRWGPLIADRFLRVFAQRLKKETGADHLIGRIGGDEFAVVLPHCPNADTALQRLENMRQALAQTVTLDANEVRLTCSAGVTFYPDDPADADGLLRHADLALYAAKEQGKDRTVVFDIQQGQRRQARRQSAKLVEEALQRGEMELFFQPKIRIADGQVIGAESLIRWRHPERGLLAPGAFLEDIAGTPVANLLDYWVLGAAFQAGQTLVSQGLPLSLSINLTVSTLIDSRFQLKVAQLLEQHPALPAQFLEVELLETETFNDLSAVAYVIQGLDALGIQCAIDDFGTGYSSLTYLQRLPAQIVKIDQSFVRDMLVNERDRTLVRGIVSLARAFERQVIAEGVETMAHAEALRGMGCDTLQGYGIARPMPLQDLIPWVRNWQPPPELRRIGHGD